MGQHAAVTFTVKSWDESTLQEWEEGAKLTRATIGYAWIGDADGETTSHDLMVYAPDGTAEIVALERFVGTLGGRRGSFVVRAEGTYDGTTAAATGVVVPGSGTGELDGLRGTVAYAATSEPPGELTLDYELP